MNNLINTSLYKNITHRSEMVLGSKAINKISESKVIIFGAGGVGSWCAESLIRSGILNLTVVDSDIICATNINRQIQTTARNIGASKAGELSERLREINPYADITSIQTVYDASTSESFDLSSYDYVIDAIDSLSSKIHLIETCIKSGITIFSSMGAAAKSDPSMIRKALLTDTRNCPLARIVRKRLRKKNLTTDILCVYSEELPVSPAVESFCGTGLCSCKCDRENFRLPDGNAPVDWCAKKRRINGALVHITAIFGFFLSSFIINDIAEKC